MKEPNELKEIWKDQYHYINYGEKHDHSVWKSVYKNDRDFLLRFWTLKAKIDSYKTQIIDACAEIDKLTRIINKIESEVK